MEKNIDWIRLWRKLVQVTSERKSASPSKAELVTRTSSRRWAKPDSTIDFIAAQLDTVPGATLLDIGAGTGRLAILLSRHAQKITSIDSSPAMIQTMQENLRAEGIANVELIQGTWPEVQVERHDFSLCSHAMYGSADLCAFVQQMMGVTIHTCFLLIRAPVLHGIMAEAATRIWGHPYDSPNFQVAYNALLQMGVFPNVRMANTGLWDPWVSNSLEEALDEIKCRFGLGLISRYDDFLIELLRRHLIFVNGQYVWPRGVRSALVYWDIDP